MIFRTLRPLITTKRVHWTLQKYNLSSLSVRTLTQPKPVTHLLFDFDGLLVDSEKYYSMAMDNVAKKHGKRFTWELKKKVICTNADTYCKIIVEDLKLPMTPKELFKELLEEYPKVFKMITFMPGAEEFLKHLNNHQIPCAIASASGSREFNQKITNLGSSFKRYFHHIVLGLDDPEVHNQKPAPDTFLVAARRFSPSAEPSRCLVFEDSAPGVLAGVRAGMQVIWIPDPQTDVDDFMNKDRELRPTQILSNIKEFRPEEFSLPNLSRDKL